MAGGAAFSLAGALPTIQATDVAFGQIPVGFQGLGTVAALVRGGQLSLIGVTTEKRLLQFPEVPTVSESGLPGFFFNSWFAMLAPAGHSEGHHRPAERRSPRSGWRSRGAPQA
jgi:tripartite-type tricarboxylate transporter receptor subunit TctC